MKEHSSSVLSSAMAQDSSVINGVSTESVATILESIVAMLGGICIGYYYCWPISLVCLACVPFMGLGGIMAGKFKNNMV